MTDFLAELPRSPSILPQKLDLIQDRVLLIAFSEAEYLAASFLDDRILTPQTKGAWAPFEQVRSAANGIDAPAPLHFILHSGHVGSTLLSRLLDEAGCVLGLREPLPLRTLADAQDVLEKPESLLSRESFAIRLQTFMKLWSRTFTDTQTVVLKATSSAARLAARLLAHAPAARAVCLNLEPEPYLATLLAGANAIIDLRAHAQERLRRLTGMVDEPSLALHALSTGELAALSWLTETLTQKRLLASFPERVLAIDFEGLLGALEPTLKAVLQHLEIAPRPDFLANVARSPSLSRYSKAPEQFAYSPQMRDQLVAQARRVHGAEIRRGMSWLEEAARRHAEVAALL